MQDLFLYFSLGWDHIINSSALDHFLFLVALVSMYTISEWKKVLILITAFTLGHSLTLVLGSLHIIYIKAPLVEFLIALTILVTCIFNVIKAGNNYRKENIKYFFAMIFGLIHGLGFASGLQSLLGRNESILTPLLGFNLGLEAGQIVIVCFILFITWLVTGKLHISRKRWIIFLSAVVFSLALKLAVERIPFLL